VNAGGAKRGFLLALFLIATLAFAALGVWQVERLFWKLDLIERVDARLAAAPVAPPASSRWGSIKGAEDEYRRVRVRGTLLNDRETLVDALTEQGPGYWVMTPLRTADGIILINRGFVPTDKRSASTRVEGRLPGIVTVTGLIRMSEPAGRFLRPNRSKDDIWFSRDVPAIARKRDLSDVAPYFIDAESSPNPGGLPIGGLTTVNFRNAHLVYALTWFGLAAVSLFGLIMLRRPPGRD